MRLFLRARFSSETSFSGRSQLTEFYKLTHPDILHNAPEKIKEENTRSIKLLNAYLDQVSQNQGVSAQFLKFYLAEKTNKKARKFQLIEVAFKPLKGQQSQEVIQDHVKEQIANLMGKVMTKRQETDPFMKKTFDVKDQDETHKFYSDYQYSMKPLQKDHFHPDKNNNEFTKKVISLNIVSTLNDIKQQELLDKIEQKMVMRDQPRSKPYLWSKIILQDTHFYKNSHSLFEHIIDPRLIYVDQNLTYEEFQTFLQKTLPLEEFESAQIQKYSYKVFQDMEQESPQIFLHLHYGYSYTEIPGFLSIPFDYTHKELYHFYKEHKNDLLEGTFFTLEKEKFDSQTQRVQKLVQELQKTVPKIHLPELKNCQQLEKLVICIKRLGKIEHLQEILQEIFIKDNGEYKIENGVGTIPVDFKHI